MAGAYSAGASAGMTSIVTTGESKTERHNTPFAGRHRHLRPIERSVFSVNGIGIFGSDTIDSRAMKGRAGAALRCARSQ